MKVLMPEAKQSDKAQFPKIFAGQYGSEISALSLDDAELVHSSFWDGDLEGSSSRRRRAGCSPRRR